MKSLETIESYLLVKHLQGVSYSAEQACAKLLFNDSFQNQLIHATMSMFTELSRLECKL